MSNEEHIRASCEAWETIDRVVETILREIAEAEDRDYHEEFYRFDRSGKCKGEKK